MEKWFENFLELLNKHSVAYLIIGGFAVGYHGYPLYTLRAFSRQESL